MTTPQDIRNNLSVEEIKTLLANLGADTYEDGPNGEHYIFPTICHNHAGSIKSMKLYYYPNTKRFMCYTDCGNSFDIYDLVKKVFKINKKQIISFAQAVEYVKLFYNINIQNDVEDYAGLVEQYKPHIITRELPAYPEHMLSLFPSFTPSEWELEGISEESMRKFDIRLWAEGCEWKINPSCQPSIIIPQRSLAGQLIGIRQRILGRDKNKYMPVTIEGKLYSCPLSMSLYGIYEHQEAIRQTKQVVILEGEKSVLKHHTFYGENSNAVACYGMKVHKPQLMQLIRNFQIQEIVIALDRQYHDSNDKDGKTFYNKLFKDYLEFANYVNISIIYDFHNLIDYKDAPVDKGKEVYEQLYQKRIMIRS